MRILITAMALAAMTAPTLAGSEKVPVIYGHEAELDACPSQGIVQRIDPKGATILALRDGPSASNKVLAKLRVGQKVALCDSKPGWLGVVVFPNSKALCGTDVSLKKPVPYSGKCKSGWVPEKSILQVSG